MGTRIPKFIKNCFYLDLLTRKLSTYLYLVIDLVAIVFFKLFKFFDLFRVPMSVYCFFILLFLSKKLSIYDRGSQFQATKDSWIVIPAFKQKKKNIIRFYYIACAVFRKSMVLNRNYIHWMSVTMHLNNVSALGLIETKTLKPSKKIWRGLLLHQWLPTEVYSESSRTLKMELFMRIVDGF